MPVDKRQHVLRHEPSLDDFDFSSRRESEIVRTPKKKTGKGRRALKDMLASMPTPSAEASYVLQRVAAFEDQIADVIRQCSDEARALVIKERKSLAHYLDDPDDLDVPNEVE